MNLIKTVFGCLFTAAVLLAGTGCTAEKAMTETRVQYFEDTAPKFIKITDTYSKIADQLVVGRFVEQRAVSKEKFDNWKYTHTNTKGQLMERGVNGEELPMRADTLNQVLEAYTTSIARTAEDENKWKGVHETYLSIRDEYLKITSKQLTLERDWADTQKQIEQFSTDAFTSIIGMATGVGLSFAW